MSERGVFAVDRGIWEHDLFVSNEPLSKLEAWMWLISEAAWKPHRRRIGGRVIELDRGQYVGSLRFIASKWRWSEPKVRRFLKTLVDEKMVDANTDAGMTVITIRNYNSFQRTSLPTDAMHESNTDAAATQQRRKVEDKENKEVITEANASAASAAPIYADSTHELWHEGVAILVQLGLADKPARSNIGRWLRDAKSDAAKVLGAIQRARDARTRDPVAFITGALKTNIKPRGGGGFLELALEIGEHEQQHSDHTAPRLIGSGN